MRTIQATRCESRNAGLAALQAIAFAVSLAALTSTAPAASFGTVELEQLTLAQARTLMLERNRDLQLARHATAGAEADVTIANAPPNPTLSVGASRFGHSSDPEFGSLRKRVDTTVGITQLFERGRKRDLRTEAAQYALAATRGEQVNIEREQRAAIDQSYYDLMLAQQRHQIALDNAGLFDKTIDAADRRVKAGDLSRADLARLNVDALRARNDVDNTRLEQDKAQVTLGVLIGMERDARRLRAAEAWPALRPVPAGAELDRLIDARADVQAARSRVQQAAKNRELAQSLRTRDVTAGVEYARTPTDAVRNSVGFNVSVPLFVRYYYQGEMKRAEADFMTAETGLERTRAAAVAEIATAAAGAASAADRLRRFQQSLIAAAEQASNGAEFAYTRGAIGVMDLLDARRQLHATRVEYVNALADYARAYSAYAAATEAAPLP